MLVLFSPVRIGAFFSRLSVFCGLSLTFHSSLSLFGRFSDARLLVEAGRLSSARFLLTTTREELAKSYILADTCRLDLKTYESVLYRLCRAFYNHIFKHAYLEVVELQFPNINSMSEAKNIWEIEVRRWWPAGAEEGEPDMPHATYFDREVPLYVDYGDYDRCWLVPANSDQNAHFMETFEETRVSKAEKLTESWRKANSVGLCSPEVLGILNAEFRKHYVGDECTREQLLQLYEKVADCLAVEKGIPRESFMTSPFVQWPLYHFV